MRHWLGRPATVATAAVALVGAGTVAVPWLVPVTWIRILALVTVAAGGAAAASSIDIARERVRRGEAAHERTRALLSALAEELDGSVATLDETVAHLPPGTSPDRRVAADRAVRRLRDLANLASGAAERERRHVDSEPVDLRAVAGDVAAELRTLGGLERVRFQADVDADTVTTPVDHFRLLLRALVEDGLTGTTMDQAVDVSAERHGGKVHVHVHAPRTDTPGLGLSLARELATQLGGEVHTASSGRSRTVTVVLPQRRQSDRVLTTQRAGPHAVPVLSARTAAR